MSTPGSPLVSEPAVQQLQAGCAHLGLPPHAAVELVRFLALKRLISLRSPSSRSLGVSPGYQLDRLWHWMLLNTQVARAVHALVGGEVEHATTDVVPLGDDTKMLRRLLALNLMAREGSAPDLTLWQEPGTVMASIVPVTLPGDATPLFVSSTTTHQQQQQLQADLQAAKEPAAAEAAVAVPAGPGQDGPAGAGQGARKRPHPDSAAGGLMADLSQQQQNGAAGGASVQPAPLHVHVVDQEAVEVIFKVRPTVRFQVIMNAYAGRKGVEPRKLRFLDDNTWQRVSPASTPADLSLVDGGIIHAVLEQGGC